MPTVIGLGERASTGDGTCCVDNTTTLRAVIRAPEAATWSAPSCERRYRPLAGSQVQIYVGFVALVVNLLVAVVLTPVLRSRKVAEGADTTAPLDYHADEESDLRSANPAVEGAATR